MKKLRCIHWKLCDTTARFAGYVHNWALCSAWNQPFEGDPCISARGFGLTLKIEYEKPDQTKEDEGGRMKDYMNIGSVPIDEDCAQVGAPDYWKRAKKECRAFKNQLERVFGEPPGMACFVVKSFPHDFGTYHEVCVIYDDTSNEEEDFAIKVEDEIPEKWDAEALEELKEPGVICKDVYMKDIRRMTDDEYGRFKEAHAEKRDKYDKWEAEIRRGTDWLTIDKSVDKLQREAGVSGWDARIIRALIDRAYQRGINIGRKEGNREGDTD